jgi:hypothetical protein
MDSLIVNAIGQLLAALFIKPTLLQSEGSIPASSDTAESGRRKNRPNWQSKWQKVENTFKLKSLVIGSIKLSDIQ